MSAVILPTRYKRQATGLVKVDYSNPLAAGLVSAYNMTSAPLRIGNQDATGKYNGRKSSAGRQPYTLHGYNNDGSTDAGLVYTDEGAAWEFGGTYATKAYNQKHPNAWSGAVTFIIRVLLHSNTADQCIIGHFNDSLTPDYLYGCGIYITGGTLYGVGANNNSRVISATAPDTGKWVTLACVTNTTDGRLYIDGQLVASGTLAGALSSYVFAIGCSGHTAAGETSGTAFLDGLVGPALTFSRALSDAEIRALSENPYQILQAANAPLWLDVVAGGSGTSLTPGAGSLALTGYAPGIDRTANQTLAPTAGNLTFSGYAPGITQGASQTIAPAGAALSLAGYAPTLVQTAHQSVTPGAGHVLLTGYAPGVSQGINTAISPGAAHLALTGYAPSMTQTAGQFIEPTAGRVTLSGHAPAIVRTENRAMAPLSGGLRWRGYAPQINGPVTSMRAEGWPSGSAVDRSDGYRRQGVARLQGRSK